MKRKHAMEINYDGITYNGVPFKNWSKEMQEGFVEGFVTNTLGNSNKYPYHSSSSSHSNSASSGNSHWTDKFNMGDPDTDDGHWVTMPNKKHIFIKDNDGQSRTASSSSSSSNTKSSNSSNSASSSNNRKRTEEYITKKQKELDEDNKRRIENKEVNKKYSGETGGAAKVNDIEKLLPVTNMINEYKANNDPDSIQHIEKRKEKIKEISKANATFSDETIDRARDFIQKKEDLYLYAYDDADPHFPHPEVKLGDKVKGTLTIGYGHTKGVKPGDRITKEEAEELFRQDFKEHASVLKAVEVPLTENQKIALASFIFNNGIEAFRSSTLLKKLNNGDFESAANEFDRWIKGGEGLKERRQKEKELFLKY